MMMMMMMNCFCGMADRRKAFSLISSRDHCQRSSPSRISDTPSRLWTCAEPEFRLSWMKLCSSDNHYTPVPFSAFIYLLKFNNRNPRKRCELCSNLTITPERLQWRRSGVFIVKFDHILYLFLMFLWLTLNK